MVHDRVYELMVEGWQRAGELEEKLKAAEKGEVLLKNEILRMTQLVAVLERRIDQIDKEGKP